MRPTTDGVNAAFPKYFEEVKREIYVWCASELWECDPGDVGAGVWGGHAYGAAVKNYENLPKCGM